MHDKTKAIPSQTRFPGYDVLAKWRGPSWNDKTREVVARRLSIAPEPRFFTPEEYSTLAAIAARIVPQPVSRPSIPVAALVDRKLERRVADGYRLASMPREGEAWRIGLNALDAEARLAFGRRFFEMSDSEQDVLLKRAEAGQLQGAEWHGMTSRDFFQRRILADIVLAYYSHPAAWSEIGWGGPASPRGYVRLDFNERDPWEAAEAKGGDEAAARRVNSHVR
jgi:gluconate 2-dehydrogenase subunit 3-like protein